MIEYD